MSAFRGQLLASVVLRQGPDLEGHGPELEASLYAAPSSQLAGERFAYVERDGDGILSVTLGSSVEDLLRVVLARVPRDGCGASHRYLARTLATHAGYDLDESRLEALEDAMDAIADMGDERAQRGRSS